MGHSLSGHGSFSAIISDMLTAVADAGEGGSGDSRRAEGRHKRPRLVWTAELHARFMNAVNHLVRPALLRPPFLGRTNPAQQIIDLLFSEMYLLPAARLDLGDQRCDREALKEGTNMRVSTEWLALS